MEEPAGYRGAALEFLNRAKARVGDILEITTDWGSVTGTLVPRYLTEDPDHIVLKLSSGYNVGLRVSGLKSAKVKAKGEKPAFTPPPKPPARKGLPKVLILGTGGTIASRVDYRTGAVRPAVSSADLHALIPELSSLAKVETEVIFNIFSENITPAHWGRLARRVAKAVLQGYEGVVIAHGTDTLGYTAAALSFALAGIPIPVVLVGAQRSSDRPSSDATLNLMGGVDLAARAPFSGVYLAMHLNESDEKIAVHRGTRVRKNHTSRRDAFESMGIPLAGVWGSSGLEYIASDLPKRGGRRSFRAKPKFESSVTLLKFYPSMPPEVITSLWKGGVRGLVIEGTGLGHLNKAGIDAVRGFTKKGGLAAMTSQCLNGRVNLNVYDTGRDLLAAGVIPLEDMIPETALVKTMWAIANSKDIEGAKSLLARNLSGETTSRTFPEEKVVRRS